MSNFEVTEVVKILENAIHENWLYEPQDVKKMRIGKLRGVYNNLCSPILYAESETREMVDYLWNIKCLTEESEIDLESAKKITCKILDFKLKKWVIWYNFEIISELIKKAILGLKKSITKEEFISVLNPLSILIGKYNFWLDSLIPWQNISSIFDLVLKESKN